MGPKQSSGENCQCGHKRYGLDIGKHISYLASQTPEIKPCHVISLGLSLIHWDPTGVQGCTAGPGQDHHLDLEQYGSDIALPKKKLEWLGDNNQIV